MARRTIAQEIRLYGTLLGLSEAECEGMASGGSQQARIGCMRDLRRRYRERTADDAPTLTTGSQQIEFWQESAPVDQFVYFVQQGDRGPVKIGIAKDPLDRMGALQTGNPTELHLRQVVPGQRELEARLHYRFREARIRGEWFGDDSGHDLSYLKLILIYAEGLASEHIQCFENGGSIPMLVGTQVMSIARRGEMQRDLARMLERYDYFPSYLNSDDGRREVNSIMTREYGLSADETEELARKLRTSSRRQPSSMRRRGGKKLGHRSRPASQSSASRS